jgi:L-seryl-tRNA(Ser) seleniumtransferase
MVRPDKLTLSALEATLRLCRYPGEAKRRVPVLAMLAATPEALRQRAESLAGRLRDVCPGCAADVRETTDETGGGSLPNVPLPGWAVALQPWVISSNELERRLRLGRIPVIVRLKDSAVLISPRTLLPGDEEALLAAVRAAYDGA